MGNSARFDLSAEIAGIVDDYSRETAKKVQRIVVETAKDCAKTLRSTSPKETGKYASGWTSKRTGEKAATVYNRNYRLTHLLEYGHAVARSGPHGKKRVAGQPHIKPVEEWGKAEIVRRFEEEL